MNPEQRLVELGIELPSAPRPMGTYVPGVLVGDLLFMSGLGPRRADGTMISGNDLGGFRPQSTKIGAPTSSHKEGRGIDIYDPDNRLDDWITDAVLELHDLYREAPSATYGWVHLTDRPPNSKRRTFLP
jgi:hypothetical protein